MKEIADRPIVPMHHANWTENEYGQVTVTYDVDVPPGEYRVSVAAQIPFRPVTVKVEENDAFSVSDFRIGLCSQGVKGHESPNGNKYDTAQTGQYMTFYVKNSTKKTHRFKAEITGRVGR